MSRPKKPKYQLVPLPAIPITASRAAVRVFMLADNTDELEPGSESFQRVVWERARESVERRGLTPKGVWALAFSALDVADWRDHLAAHVVDQIEANMRELDGTPLHWRVCALVDSADIS